MSEQIHAKGAHVSKLNPAWVWPPSAREAEEEVPPPVVLPDMPLINSFPVDKQNEIDGYGIETSGTRGGYQVFTADVGGVVHSAYVSLNNPSGAPLEGNVVVSLHTASGSGAGMGPMFPPIAVSDPVDVKTIGSGATATAGVLYEFIFSGANQIELVAGETYAISVTKDDNGMFAENVFVGFRIGTPASGHAGNGGTITSQLGQPSWQPDSISDMIFYLYTPEAIEPEPIPEDPTIEDSWPVEHKNDDGSYGFYGSKIGCSMSFVAKRGGVLDRAQVWMKRSEPAQDPPTSITAHIYDTSQPIGNAKPEGVALASSDPVDTSTLQPATIPPHIAPVEFFFTGANQIQLVKDKVYCLAFHRPTPLPDPVWDSYRFGFDHSLQPPMADGNYSDQNLDGQWATSYTYFDMIFYVHSLP